MLVAEPYPGAVETCAPGTTTATGSTSRATAAERAHEPHRALARARSGCPTTSLHCSYDKVSRCLEIGIDVLIDDSPVNLERALEEGITAATLVHPWNREI